MKLFYIECDADEMSVNRTILDSISELLNSVTKAMAGVDVTPEMLANAMEKMQEETESEDKE